MVPKEEMEQYKSRHDWVGKVIYWELCKRLTFDHANKWYMHKTVLVIDWQWYLESYLGLWDSNGSLNPKWITQSCPQGQNSFCELVDFVIPVDLWVKIKDKIDKDLDLARELKSFNVIPIIGGAFNKFPDFFVQVFKIVIYSWKFSIILLYILWDDWPIFMISGSNEQLQQQLEYTLLKPDYHSWWISKMQSGHEDTLEEWYAIKFYFKLGKNATETYGMLQTAFWSSCMNRASVFEWHKRFKEGRESVRDNERCGRSKETNTPELIGQMVRVRVTMILFINPSARAGYDTRSIFKRSLTGLKSEFSFS